MLVRRDAVANLITLSWRPKRTTNICSFCIFTFISFGRACVASTRAPIVGCIGVWLCNTKRYQKQKSAPCLHREEFSATFSLAARAKKMAVASGPMGHGRSVRKSKGKAFVSRHVPTRSPPRKPRTSFLGYLSPAVHWSMASSYGPGRYPDSFAD